MLSGERELSYLGAGDLFLSLGLYGEHESREKCILALKALLAADSQTAPSSVSAIRENIKLLGYTLSDDEFNSLRKQSATSSDIIHFRRRIWSFFNEGAHE